MMASVQSYVRRSQRLLRKWAIDPKLHVLAETTFCALTGILASAASLARIPITLTLGLLCAAEGWQAVMVGLGGIVGYLLFWSDAGLQGVLWMAAGLGVVLPLGGRRLARSYPLLMPAIAGLIVSAGGVVFQNWMNDTTSVPLYLVRVVLASASTWIFSQLRERNNPIVDSVAMGFAVLALAQIVPVPYLGLGFLAAGIIAVSGTFPTVALAGLALDLAQITRIPMTAVLCMAYLVRLLPKVPKWISAFAPSIAGLALMSICNILDVHILPGLLIGGAAGVLIPRNNTAVIPRRGETGAAQVQLELASGVLAQSEQLLLEVPEAPTDNSSLVIKAAERACSGCPCRKTCKDMDSVRQMPGDLLSHALLSSDNLPVTCRKSGRVLLELRRSQEQLRSIRANRERLRECRWAMIQQYRFLSEYLQDLSDRLSHRNQTIHLNYRPDIAGSTTGREEADGDRCSWFLGTEGKYYVLLCDGMGTGLGAARESKDATTMLRRLLIAGYPAEYALRSLNSLCALRGQAGAVTIDLAELHLDTGKASLYKWGAAPSYLVGDHVTEKIGTVGPPPGLSVTDGQETVDRLSLRRGETLILLSDGVDGEIIHRRAGEVWDRAPGEVAARILKMGRGDGADDATAVVVRLIPDALST